MKSNFLKRTVTFLLVMCMAFSFAVSASANETAPSAALSLAVSSSGNTITAVVGLSNTNVGISGIDFKLSFDNSKLTFTGASGSIFGFSFSSADKANNNGYVYALGSLNAGDTTATGTVATITFSLKENAAGHASFNLISGNGSDAKGNSFALALPESQTLEVAGYKITYKSAANGTISGVSVSPSNDTVVLTAKPNTGYEVDSVTASADTGVAVAVSGSGNSYSFTMPAAYVTVSATFKEITYRISKGTVSDGGSVTLSAETANYGDSVTITATPKDGYEVDAVTATGTTVKNAGSGKYTFKMPASDVSVNVTFKEKSDSDSQNKNENDKTSGENVPADYSITLKKAENGTFTTNLTSAAKDTTVHVTTTPDEGYRVKSLAITDLSGNLISFTGENNAYTFVMPNGAVTVEVSFEMISEGSFDAAASETQNNNATPNENIAGDDSTATTTPNADTEVGVSVEELPSETAPQETEPETGILLWILIVILVLLISVLFTLLMIKMKRQKV